MKKYLSSQKIRTSIVIVIAFISVFFTSPEYFSQLLNKPSGHIFVGMTTYFEDFYYYLDQFYQGKQGNWLTENRFSIERFPSTIIYFNHVLLGKLGGLVRLESFESYNYFGLIFKFLFIFSSFFLIKKIITKQFSKQITAYVFLLISTAFPNISIQQGVLQFNLPTDIFRSANRVLSRFGISPNGMLINFLFVVLVLILLRYYQREFLYSSHANQLLKQRLRISVNMFWVLGIAIAFSLIIIGDLVIAMTVLLSLYIVLAINKIPPKKMPVFYTLVVLLTVLCVGLGTIVVLSVQADPVYRSANAWDVTQYLMQINTMGVLNFLKGFGLQLPFGLMGLYLMLRKKDKTIYEQFGITLVGISLLGYSIPIIFQIPILGFRFLFPAMYIFISIFVLYAFEYIAKNSKIQHLYACLLIGYLCINLLVFYRGWSYEFKPLEEPYFHFAYIPVDLYNGLIYLRDAEPLNGNVLASSTTSIDLMIPGISGRYTYSGHSLTTYNAKTKDNNSSNFFFVWTNEKEIRDFLRSNNIRFIFVSKYSQAVSGIKTYGPFLKVAYENPMVTIFRYDLD